MNDNLQLNKFHTLFNFSLLCALLIALGCSSPQRQTVITEGDTIKISEHDLHFFVVKKGFRFGFKDANNDALVPPHPQSGLLAGNPDDLSEATETTYSGEDANGYKFLVDCGQGPKIQVRLSLDSAKAKFQLESQDGDKLAMALRTAGVSPGYGLADHLIDWNFGAAKDYATGKAGTDITGFSDDHYNSSSGHITRLVSNFAIYPTHKFAVINIDPETKVVRSTKEEMVQGSRSTSRISDLYYFFGDPKEIYRSFLEVRNKTDYPVMKPKYEFFGVGWEAYGALGWRTNEQTVTQDVDQYLELGYPLTWMVVGSGFWPYAEERFKATTSFGMWDPEKYPDPERFKDYFHKKGLKIFVGLRIAFITDGPYSKEGTEKGYFIKENGEAKVFDISFPKEPVYLLDEQNPEAVEWYVALCDKWKVDGFKEDLFGYGKYPLRDDKINTVNERLMEKGYYVMLRNTYLSSPGELHRINDFNYDMDQDRGPVNSLAYAYSGFPLTYFDIVGGLFGGRDFDGVVSERIKTYMMRNMRAATLHPSISVGKGPWHFNDEQVSSVMLDAAKLHGRLHPYFYSQAVRFYQDGYPWSMTPLPVAYPNDPNVHGRENNVTRGYQWMIGDALMAYPLYGEDYETATTRDVYLPEGKWIDYDNGQEYEGPTLLEDFKIPVEKTPLFVGGTGIVIEEIDRELIARIFPVANKASTVFYGRDGESASHISVENPDWSQVKVLDKTTGKEIISKRNRYAYEFKLETGHDYVVR